MKISQQILDFFDHSIIIDRTKFSLVLREYFPLAFKVLTSNHRILDRTNKDLFQLNSSKNNK